MAPPLRPGENLYVAALEAATGFLSEHSRLPELDELAAAIHVDIGQLTPLFGEPGRLVEAVAENAMLLLHDHCIRSVVQVQDQDPLRQMEALSQGFLEWAYRYPREFQLIGLMPANQFEGARGLLRYEQALHDVMLQLYGRAHRAGMVQGDDDPAMLIAIAHTFAYGVASKMLLGDLSRWAPDSNPLEGARATMRVFMRRMLGVPDRPAT